MLPDQAFYQEAETEVPGTGCRSRRALRRMVLRPRDAILSCPFIRLPIARSPATRGH